MHADTMSQERHIVQRSFSSDDITTTASQGYAPPLQPVASQVHHQYRSLRARRAQHNLKLPPHLRRHTTMDENSWLQSFSDIEAGSHLNRYAFQGMARSDTMPAQHGEAFIGSNQRTLQTTPSSSMNPSHNGARLTPLGLNSNYNSPVWPTEPQPLIDGMPGAPVSSTWAQSSYNSFLSDASLSIPSTPASVGLYQSHVHDTSRQMPHLNTPPGSAVSFAKLGSNGPGPKLPSKLDTGSHSYFKENSSEIMKKWFGNTTNPVALSQLYNGPPPASLSSQDSFNDTSSASSRKKQQLLTPGLYPVGSDLSSQLSFTNANDYASQSPVPGTVSSRKRLPIAATGSPAPLSRGDLFVSGTTDPPSAATSTAHSMYESDSNYAASSVPSSQPSRLPSPALSDNHRSAQNAFLIEARGKGMSYREIKIKGGFTEAESTLRGRHRMLTKDKESRVRKPEWTETDIELLKKAVRIHTRGNLRTGKISWKSVAEYITENGGSYSFAYATCHNKWKELQSSRRR